MKTISSTPFRERIDYISTALAYCWLIWISNVRHAIQSGTFYIMRLFVLIILPQKYLDKFDEHHADALEAQEILFGDLECGHEMRTAKQMIFHTFIGYMTFPVIVVASIICSLIGWDFVFYWEGGVIPIVIILIWAVLLFIGLTSSTKALDIPRVYISYFREFEKQDEEWLRKWKRNTILLFVGGLLLVAASIGFVFLCVAIKRNFQ